MSGSPNQQGMMSFLNLFLFLGGVSLFFGDSYEERLLRLSDLCLGSSLCIK